MPRRKKSVIEFRDYPLNPQFSVLLLTGEDWRISDVPSGRLHIHNCLEIGLCETDSGFMRFEDTECPFKAGDVTIVSCDVPHTTYSAPGTASRWSYLFVDLGQLLQPYVSAADLRSQNLLTSVQHRLHFILGNKENPAIFSLVAGIVEEMKQKRSYYELTVRGLFLAFLTELARTKEAQDGKSDDPRPENALVIAPALERIRCHYMEDFPMDDLAALCGLSPTHFRRLFSSVMGSSPLEYLITTRIRNGADRLRMSEDSILSVSEEVGFHSLSSFNRHFLAIMGQTPREWRSRVGSLNSQSVQKYTGWLVAETLQNPGISP